MYNENCIYGIGFFLLVKSSDVKTENNSQYESKANNKHKIAEHVQKQMLHSKFSIYNFEIHIIEYENCIE